MLHDVAPPNTDHRRVPFWNAFRLLYARQEIGVTFHLGHGGVEKWNVCGGGGGPNFGYADDAGWVGSVELTEPRRRLVWEINIGLTSITTCPAAASSTVLIVVGPMPVSDSTRTPDSSCQISERRR
ncbi:hypothetical protein Moror_5429 [Moniliophthora roreri MCA 2997]|uniref:Uncharacterized protein n=1 Tax=Moniliophthora roreri (strain MCA 2997) TaxID=1381753 RepID=V2WPS0_MONRO|nr:hypothetical protein Moror_5429 [Moniliophthora roreri MCA 2997]